MDYSKFLSETQLSAVQATEGPVLILAGAGSGKTRVLTYRMAYLITEKGVSPDNVLAATFTNKAAGEMKERVKSLLGNLSNRVLVGTFHSICARILRMEGKKLGYGRNFVIYDEDDQLNVIKEVMKSLNVSTDEYYPRAVHSRISLAKNRFLYPEDLKNSSENYFDEKLTEIYSEYQKKLRMNNAFDFDDLLIKPVELFKRYPDIKKKYQNRFRYILVDEYQDTNFTQYLMIKELAGKYGNICVVGDDDQSIYRWRGADIRNILSFEKTFPECMTFKLEQNYRSTKTIISAAGAVVSNNINRKEKALWTQRKKGEKITLLESVDEYDETDKIIECIKDEVFDAKRAFKDFAILYRTNAQSRVIEDGLRRNSLSYNIVGGIRFYERKEIKDILAYFRVISNPRDAISLRRIINFPPRGIGESTLKKIQEFIEKKGITFFNALKRIDEINLQSRIKNNIQVFYSLIKKYIELKNKISFEELARVLVEEIGIIRLLKKENTEDSLNRMYNIMELLEGISDYIYRNPDGNLEGFLEEVSLITDIDSWDDSKNAVTLMTAHSAKGLEFPVVFITGLEDGLFPLSSSFGEMEAMEEERRLFYVAMTRAKDKVYLSYALNRTRFGDGYNTRRSRFIDEIPSEYMEYDEDEVIIEKSDFPVVIERVRRSKKRKKEKETELSVGQWVRHNFFGKGRIVDIKGKGDNLKVLVVFDGNLVKKLMVKYANLKIIDND